MTQSDRPGILVPARFIPTPRSISPQAQAFLSNPPPFEAPEYPAVTDRAGWREFIKRMNDAVTARAKMWADSNPTQLVTHPLSASSLYELTPHNQSPRNERRAILYIHGGGFIVGHGIGAAYMAAPIACGAQTRTYPIDYRMPPDHPFPAALDDVVEAYRFLLKRYKPQNIAFHGASAGGNLATACLLKARELGLPMPAACALHSPACDLTESGDTFETNAIIDIVLRQRSPRLLELYAGGHDRRDPMLSPVFGDYHKDFPPTILTSGTRDLLLSSTVMLHRALRRAGVKAELHVWEAMTHGIFFNAPEEKELYSEQIDFMLSHMGED